MSISKLFRPRILISVSLILVLAVLAFAYAAANVVPESGAGDGNEAVSGYTITLVTYILLDSDPTKVERVDFTVLPTDGADVATDVRITVDSGTTWVTCTNVTTAWTCSFAGGSEPTVLAITNLQVVAVQ